jgi:hypothetical protein
MQGSVRVKVTFKAAVQESADNMRNAENKEIIVRQYGLQPPPDWDENALQVLRLQNRLWNTLVEIDHVHTAAYRNMIAAHDNVKPLEEEMGELRERKRRLRGERKQRRKAARTRVPTPEIDTELKSVAARIGELMPRIKTARQLTRRILKPQLDALERTRREQVKTARRQSSLWWPNYNAVVQSYNVARSRALREGTELRFHHFDGSGRFTFQVQGGMTVAELFAGSNAALQADPIDPAVYADTLRGHRRAGTHTTLRMAIASEPGKKEDRYRRLACPMTMERPIPENALIKLAVIKRRRIGSDFQWTVTFTCTREGSEQALRTNLESRCGLNFGWRIKRCGDVRVAMLADNAGGRREYTLPAKMLKDYRFLDALRKRQDDAIDAILPHLKEAFPTELTLSPAEACAEAALWLRRQANEIEGEVRPPNEVAEAMRAAAMRCDEAANQPLDRTGAIALLGELAAERAANESNTNKLDRLVERLEALPERVAKRARCLRASRVGGRKLSALVWDWRMLASAFESERLEKAEAWRKQHKRLYDTQSHLAVKLQRRRTDLYRNWAKEIATQYANIVMENTNYRQLLRRESASGEESEMRSTVRALYRLAAPAELRKWIGFQAAKVGSCTRLVPSSGMTLLCHHCGHSQNLTDGKNDRLAMMWRCGHCNSLWDKDENFAKNLLKEASRKAE